MANVDRLIRVLDRLVDTGDSGEAVGFPSSDNGNGQTNLPDRELAKEVDDGFADDDCEKE